MPERMFGFGFRFSAALINPRDPEALAAELHKEYRAANKALFPGGATSGGAHDHGWKKCHKQKYFRRRAQRLIARLTSN